MNILEELAATVGGKIESVGGPLSDGSGFAVMSMPLSKDHWSMVNPDEFGVPPMPMRMGVNDPPVLGRTREQWRQAIITAGKYAYRASTMNGKEPDLDPDALLQNMVVGLLGYFTEDGLSYWDGKEEEFANPQPHPPKLGDA